MRLLQTLLAASLLALSSACMGGDPDALIDQGNATLTKDPATALSNYEKALGEIDASNPRYLEAKLGMFKAQSYVDPAGAQSGFLAFAKEKKLPANDYRLQVEALYLAAVKQAGTGTAEDMAAGTSTIEIAIDLLVAGSEVYPDDPKWQPWIAKVGDKGTDLGASDDKMSRLKGIGYVGGD